MELSRKNNIKVYEKNITLFDVYNSDECFLTGTAVEIVPVIKVDTKLIGSGKVGNITKKIILLFRELING